MSESSDSYFIAVGPNRFMPTTHAGGAWSDEELHFSPIAGLVTHHLETWRAEHSDGTKLISRISFDILGRIPRSEIELETRVIRPGRTIELLETTATIDGRPTITARAWALSAGDTTEVSGEEFEPLPDRAGLPDFNPSVVWPGGFIASVKAVQAGGARAGRAQVWISSDLQLVDTQPSSPLANYVTLLDTANGMAVRESPTEWMFPNVDLTAHFFRQPVFEQPDQRWVGFDLRVAFGATGQGLSSTVLHDTIGPVGTMQQILTVRPQPAGR